MKKPIPIMTPSPADLGAQMSRILAEGEEAALTSLRAASPYADAIIEEVRCALACHGAGEALSSTQIVSLPLDRVRVKAKPRVVGQVSPGDAASHLHSGATWRLAEPERLAASDAETSGDGRRVSASKADLVQFIPGATNGEVALGYLCAGGVEVIVTGVGDRPAKVLLNGKDYDVRNGAANEPRVVDGLTRQHIAVWLAGGLDGGFTIVYP